MDKTTTDNERAIEASESPHATEAADKTTTDNERAIEASESPHATKSQNIPAPATDESQVAYAHDTNDETEKRKGGNKDTAERPTTSKGVQNNVEGGGMVAGNDRSETNSRRAREQRERPKNGQASASRHTNAHKLNREDNP